MREVSDYVHSKGLKFGLYTDLGDRSCGPGPGSYGHYDDDACVLRSPQRTARAALTTAPPCRRAGRAGSSSLRLASTTSRCGAARVRPAPSTQRCAPLTRGCHQVDHCGETPTFANELEAWNAMRDALNKTGRPIYLSTCPKSIATAVRSGEFQRICSFVCL